MNPCQRSQIAAILISLCIFATNVFSQVTWTATGPGGGGWLSCITVVDDEANTIYVGCDVGGVYKSTDHGQTWQIMNTGLTTYYVQDIAFDPQTPTTLFAATRGGVFKSTDGGNQWVGKRSGFPPENEYSYSAPLSDILIDPDHTNIIYAATGVPRAGYVLDSFHWQEAGAKGTVFKSTNGGEDWAPIRGTGIDTTAMIYSLAMDPTNSGILFAATSSGIYRSTSAGETWTPKSSGLPHLLTMTLVLDADNPQIIYTTLWAEPGSPTWEGGVYKSTDGGDSWVAKNNGLPQVMGSEMGLTSNFPLILMDPLNSLTLYVGNRPWTPDPGVYKSTDGGENWTWMTRNEQPGQNVDMGWITDHGLFVRCLALDPNHPDRLYFGTSTSLFKTEDGGGYWDQVYTSTTDGEYWRGHGLETSCIQDIAVDPANSDNIYVGYWDMGLMKSIDGGITFKRLKEGMNYESNTFSIIVDPASPNIIYAATGWWTENEGEVCRSEDFGETWTVLNNGIPDAQIWSLALDETSPADSRTLYATSYQNGVVKTTDGGQNWFPVNNGLGVSGNLQVRKILIDPNDPDILYAGIEALTVENGDQLETIQGGLFKSTNAGLSWTRIVADLLQINVWDIDVDPRDSQVIYTSVCDHYDHSVGITFYGGIYRSNDGGITWTNNNQDFGDPENLEIKSVAISPVSSNILYAVTSDYPYHDLNSGRGIFKSTDAGLHWTAVNDGLGVLNFSVITIDPSDPSRLYAGSGGNGLLRGTDGDISHAPGDELLPACLLMPQNVPNPFNPGTKIEFSLPSRQDVTLRVYDIRGQLVRTLVSGPLDEGSHAATWNGQDDSGGVMATGVYFYRLVTEEGALTRKMTLLK